MIQTWKRYIANATALSILTAAAVLLFLARVTPNAVEDRTKRMDIFEE